ncbi:hypothetical protein PMIN06_006557 [Paraphaeosphaeria minitans]|uniref:Meiotically up-regulated gene 151 protein n=1 Tax=Paraphaeosphaeria minitans TaxID=565426 RepID=A0A9P6G827_9PLEO|nr:Meiotically up-regulated gene 151 protein [Paraphaeosphaeria minitans]
MLGIHYVSSDEEDVAPVVKPEVSFENTWKKDAIATNIEWSKPPSQPAAASISEPVSAIAPSPNEKVPTPTALPEGPSQGPSAIPQTGYDEPTEDASPGSRYTSNRLMIQNLTLPTVPNLNIPPSPPGSPPRRSTEKFTRFLELKKKGQHFNQRLENSSVVRDPNHSKKLMDFASITDEDRYASTLPQGLGVPVSWPDWAYGEALNASQKIMITKAKESERSRVPRGSVDFVPAKSGTTSGKGSRQIAAERAIGGTDSRSREKR